MDNGSRGFTAALPGSRAKAELIVIHQYNAVIEKFPTTGTILIALAFVLSLFQSFFFFLFSFFLSFFPSCFLLSFLLTFFSFHSLIVRSFGSFVRSFIHSFNQSFLVIHSFIRFVSFSLTFFLSSCFLRDICSVTLHLHNGIK